MTNEQYDFWSDIKEVSETLAEWVETKFNNGFSIVEVKKFLKEAAKVAGRE
jgi:hypothetical protein